jgi:hypothetical protein
LEPYTTAVPDQGHRLIDFVQVLCVLLKQRKGLGVSLHRTLPESRLETQGTAALRLTRHIPGRFTAHVEVIVVSSGKDLFITCHRYFRFRNNCLLVNIALISSGLITAVVLLETYVPTAVAVIGDYWLLRTTTHVSLIAAVVSNIVLRWQVERPDGERESMAMFEATAKLAIADAVDTADLGYPSPEGSGSQ